MPVCRDAIAALDSRWESNQVAQESAEVTESEAEKSTVTHR